MNSYMTIPYNVEELSFHSLRSRLKEIDTKNVDSYVLSATYYLLTGRKGGWMYYTNNSLVVISKHPHIEKCLIIFPEISSKYDFSLTAEVLQSIDRYENGVFLCRYTTENFEKLKSKLSVLTNNRVQSLVRIPEEILDWKYPIRILDTQIVSELKGGNFRKIRNKNLRAGEGIEIIPIEQCNQMRLMRAALKFWEGNMILHEKDTVDMAEFYHELFGLIQEGLDMINGLCFIKEGRPLGFTAWDVCSNDIANLYVNLADTTITGSSDFQLISTCRFLHQKGVKLLNMGGSESDYLDQFKEKYMPVISHNVFTYKVL